MLDESGLEGLRQTLDQNHAWPCEYVFKFIVPKDQALRLSALLDEERAKVSERASRSGKYLSFTVQMRVASSEEVIMVYQRVSDVPGLVAL